MKKIIVSLTGEYVTPVFRQGIVEVPDDLETYEGELDTGLISDLLDKAKIPWRDEYDTPLIDPPGCVVELDVEDVSDAAHDAIADAKWPESEVPNAN